MAAEILSFDRSAGTARVRVDEFVVGFAMSNNKLVLTSKVDESSSRMDPGGIYVPEGAMSLARRAAYAVLTDGKKPSPKLGTLPHQLMLI